MNQFLSHRYLPVFLALGAVLVMLPALKSGLMADDLVQRAVELRSDQLPARLRDAGIPPDSGSLGAVLRDLFPGVGTNPQSVAQAKNYGVLPWWTPDDMSLGLWRPLTAFTHWLDYQLFPDSSALMHAHNIAWFAAVVFLVAMMYRKLMGPGWAAGLAALLFLLDAFLYVPVMFVANRGFVLSLCFGLLSFYEHQRWRSAAGRGSAGQVPMVLSALFLALALFANEGGASTLAFILAYALVLEPGPVRTRALTVLPAVLVIGLWRVIYKLGGFGIFHVGLYIDPGTEPFAFARVAIPRATALLGGQITGVAPDFLFAIKPSLHPAVIALYGGVVAAAVALFFPWVRRNKIAAFWLAVAVLATIPAATVAPLSKNLGFVAVGVYGLMASFIAALVTRPVPPSPQVRDYGAINRLPEHLACRIPAWIACGLLLVMHIPVAIAGRAVTAGAIVSGSKDMRSFINLDKSSDVDNKNVIVVNAPCAITLAYMPFYKAYYHQPLPRTLRTLVPGCTSFDVQRTDDRTLMIQSRTSDVFTCDDVGPAHIAYIFSACNVAVGVPKSKKGDRHDFDGLTVEVLEANAADVATRVAFQFDTSLDSPNFRWLWWDWRTLSYKPFAVPAIGRSVTLAGPSRRVDGGGQKHKE